MSDKKVSNAEEVLKGIHRFNQWAASFNADGAEIESRKQEMQAASTRMEMALLEGREELAKLRELAGDEQIQLAVDMTFLKRCDSFRPKAALLGRFGIGSTDGDG